MKRLLFLVEGDPEDHLTNFSGIPYYFTRALRDYLASFAVELDVIETNYLFNTEELLHCFDDLSNGKNIAELMPHVSPELRYRKLDFPLNRQLLLQAQKVPVNSNDLEHYYSRISEHMGRLLEDRCRPGDVILSQNHFYPYIGENRSVHYFLDASLVDFYFNDRFGTVRAIRTSDLEPVYVQMEQAALKSAQKVFCFSRALKDFLRERYAIREERLVVVGGGANLESFPEPLFRKQKSHFDILFVGLDFERKGGRVLLKAMELLRSEPVRLTVVTSTALADISCPENVITFPPGDKEFLENLYRSADAFVFPTLFEPFGLVVIEAMAYSLPVISTKVFAIPELLGTNDPFLVVDPGDVLSVVEGIRHLMRHPEISSVIGTRNFLRARANFQWSIVAEKLVSSCLSHPICDK